MFDERDNVFYCLKMSKPIEIIHQSLSFAALIFITLDLDKKSFVFWKLEKSNLENKQMKLRDQRDE